MWNASTVAWSGLAERLSRMMHVKVDEQDVARLIRACRTKDNRTVRTVIRKIRHPGQKPSVITPKLQARATILLDAGMPT
jgi:hypothetical protein